MQLLADTPQKYGTDEEADKLVEKDHEYNL